MPLARRSGRGAAAASATALKRRWALCRRSNTRIGSPCREEESSVVHRRPSTSELVQRDTRSVFDGMPAGSRNEMASTEIVRDRLSALPDEAIHHVLGFLPANEAARTSILARGWRHHWKSMHNIFISASANAIGGFLDIVPRLMRLVDRVLLNRHVPLEQCHIDIDDIFCQVDDAEIHNWIVHAVSKCHVRVLIVDIDSDIHLKIKAMPIVSRYLKRLELTNILLGDEILDLSCCRVLEDLRLSSCDIVASKISSWSVKRVMITSCSFNWSDGRTCISAPNTISLKLDNNYRTTPTPLLECIPLLQNAFVRLVYFYGSYCPKSDDKFFNCGICEDCRPSEDENDGYMLLGGLSSATHLELIAPIVKFTDWKCPTFDKLKTLLLNEWCVAIDLGALRTILQHSPCLEKLTLQLNEGPKQTMVKEETYLTEQSPAISKHLNVVEIKCTKVNERVYEIIKMLSTFDLQINIMRTNRSTDCFSFEFWESLGC